MFPFLILGEIFAVFVTAGWITGRLNRKYRRGLLLMLASGWTLWFFCSTSSYWLMLVADSWSQPSFRPYLGHFLLRYIVAITGFWLGGRSSVLQSKLCTDEP